MYVSFKIREILKKEDLQKLWNEKFFTMSSFKVFEKMNTK